MSVIELVQPPSGEHTDYLLYRVFDHEGALLYVGQTLAPVHRFATHQRQKNWWRDVATIALQHFQDLDAVSEAEREAIRGENPVHNILHSRRSSPPAGQTDLTVVDDGQCSPLIHPRLEPTIRVRLDAYCQRERRSITNAVNKLLDDALTAVEADTEARP